MAVGWRRPIQHVALLPLRSSPTLHPVAAPSSDRPPGGYAASAMFSTVRPTTRCDRAATIDDAHSPRRESSCFDSPTLPSPPALSTSRAIPKAPRTSSKARMLPSLPFRTKAKGEPPPRAARTARLRRDALHLGAAAPSPWTRFGGADARDGGALGANRRGACEHPCVAGMLYATGAALTVSRYFALARRPSW